MNMNIDDDADDGVVYSCAVGIVVIIHKVICSRCTALASDLVFRGSINETNVVSRIVQIQLGWNKLEPSGCS